MQASDYNPAQSPIVFVYDRLRRIHPNWFVEFGRQDGDGWIAGDALVNPDEQPLSALLARIGTRLKTDDRKVIAASFALRFGWSAAVAIAPFLLCLCVPDIRLNNISVKFSDATFFERVSLLEARGVMVRRDGIESHPLVEILNPAATGEKPENHPELLSRLRSMLVDQAGPVIDVLHTWARFSKRALWGQVASSWGAQFTNILGHLGRHHEALAGATVFFGLRGFLNGMCPDFYPVTHCGVTRIYYRRASCCLYYRLPTGSYCASCPLIAQEERVRRNKQWIEKTDHLKHDIT